MELEERKMETKLPHWNVVVDNASNILQPEPEQTLILRQSSRALGDVAFLETTHVP